MAKQSPPNRQPEPSVRETEREALLEEAMKNPGVADVVRVYGDLAKYRVGTVAPEPKVQFATGGND